MGNTIADAVFRYYYNRYTSEEFRLTQSLRNADAVSSTAVFNLRVFRCAYVVRTLYKLSRNTPGARKFNCDYASGDLSAYIEMQSGIRYALTGIGNKVHLNYNLWPYGWYVNTEDEEKIWRVCSLKELWNLIQRLP